MTAKARSNKQSSKVNFLNELKHRNFIKAVLPQQCLAPKQVRSVDSDVSPPPFSVNEPYKGVGDPIEARVDQSSVANVVEVTPCAPPPTAAKRKCSE